MKICVVGAGAIGGLIGARLHNSGQDVTLIARGPHLQAIRQNGLKLQMNDGTSEIAQGVAATDKMAEVGEQDLVILGLKAHQIAPVVDDIRTLFGPDTTVLTTQNGIPWWYFQRHGGEFEGRVVRAVDPEGILASRIEPERILGCIAYPAAEITQPGSIRHIEGTRFPVGELDGSESDRAQQVSKALIDAGFKSPILDNIRAEIWLKAWGNLTFNPISALTHSTLVDICQFAPSRELAASMMKEAQDIAGKLGVTFRLSLEKRIDGAEKVGKHKTSMLQDVEVGKALEIEALLGAIVEFGKLTNTPIPHLDAVYALIRLLDKTVHEEGVFIKARSTSVTPPKAASA